MRTIYIISGIIAVVIGILISGYSFCTTQLTFSNGNVMGGCYANPYFIPYGLGLMIIGFCLIAFGTLSKRKPVTVVENNEK